MHVITQPCIGTKETACVNVCPTDSIHPKPDEPEFEHEEHLFIDPDTCIDCGLCVDACPVHATHPEDQVPDDQKSFIEQAREWYAARK